ncbi:MAG: polysaccharide export protein [Verrucomicrobia bacterium]|nr:polysaccharide export protein [Verrucomicrobiota bacterium]
MAFVLGACCAIAAQAGSSDRAVAGKSEGGGKGDYVLQPSDLLKVQIFQEEDLTREVRISQEYTISLPLIKTVDLTGKTKAQAEELIRSLYARDFFVNPQVTVNVLEYVPRKVSVLGQVNTPGAVLFFQEQGLTLIDAISKAGGFTRLARKKEVTLKRTEPDGTTKTFTINCEELTKGATNSTWPLQPNDVIDVPERIM